MTKPAVQFGLPKTGTKPVEVAILVAPSYFAADMIGVHAAMGLLAAMAPAPCLNLHLVWKNTDEVMGFPTLPTRPTTRFADCPADLDLLIAPAVGAEVFEDTETLEFLADRGLRARWVAGSCLGSLLLGVAGLLRGYRATTNFHAIHLLPHVGATYVPGSVVEDRNRITAGPATGSFDIAFRVIQDVYGDDVAREMILHLEYAPRPLFDVGTPELAGPELSAQAMARCAAMFQPFDQILERASVRLGVRV